MKKISVFLLLCMMFSISCFSQNATIDGQACANSTDCPKYVCEGSTINLVAGITSGSIDSLKWRERIWNGVSWTAWATIGTTVTKTVPNSGSAIIGYAYRYQLIVYQGGIQYFALADMYVNAIPTAILLASSTTTCSGTAVTFTASAGGTNYDFKVNGISRQNGVSSSFTTSTLINGDIVTVAIMNASGCTKTSTPITMTINPKPTVTSVTGNLTPGCIGQTGNVTIIGLTGTGPWTLEVWTDVAGNPGVLYYSVPGTITTTNATINVPIPAIGFSTLHLRITDANGCRNF